MDPRRGVHPGWLTFLLAFLTLALATGLLALYPVNLPFTLGEEAFSRVRFRSGAVGPDWLLRSALVVLVTPVLAVEMAPLALPFHVLALAGLLTLALERVYPGGPAAWLALSLGIGFALVTPMPGLYSYPNPFPAVSTLLPRYLIPIVLFFGDPRVRFLFPVLAYLFPVLAMVLAGAPRNAPDGRDARLRLLPVLLLPFLMVGGMLLVLSDGVRIQLVGLIVNWGAMTGAFLLWAGYYRPRVGRLHVPPGPGRLTRFLTGWRNPAAAFVGLVLVVLVVAGLPPVDAFVEGSAPAHHGQHVVLFLVGLVQGGIVLQQVLAYRKRRGLSGEFARFVYVSNTLYNPRGIPGIAFAVGAVALWHVPFFWDLALRNDLVHFLEHSFVLAAGSAVAFSLPRMRRGSRFLLLLISLATMALLSLSLWFAPFPVYTTYSHEELARLGKLSFLAGMPVLLLAVVLAIRSVRALPDPASGSEDPA